MHTGYESTRERSLLNLDEDEDASTQFELSSSIIDIELIQNAARIAVFRMGMTLVLVEIGGGAELLELPPLSLKPINIFTLTLTHSILYRHLKLLLLVLVPLSLSLFNFYTYNFRQNTGSGETTHNFIKLHSHSTGETTSNGKIQVKVVVIVQTRLEKSKT